MIELGLRQPRCATLSVALVSLMLGGPVCGKDTPPARDMQKPSAAAKAQTPAAPQAPDTAGVARDTGAASATTEPKKETVRVDVYLFHGTYRCYSCNLMEQLTVEAIEQQLATEKKNGRVSFSHINVDEPQHQHFIDDYRLAAISLVLSQKSGSKETQWKNLEQVWPLLRSPERFKSYVVKEIRAYLEG